MKLCVDCKHFKRSVLSSASYGKCWKGKIDPVEGQPTDYAESMRKWNCGPDGQLFEQKFSIITFIRNLRK